MIQPVLVFIGTYTRGPSRGIYVTRLDPASGSLASPEVAAEAQNPSFLAIHPGCRILYAVGETGEADAGGTGGTIGAFSIDPASGRLSLLNRVPSGGANPCYVTVDRLGACVLVANYTSGSVAAVPLRPDGSLAEPACVIRHAGASVHPSRQRGPHAHSINVDPGNRFALVADLGLDKLLTYGFDAATGALSPQAVAETVIKPGAGPRHVTFHPSGRFVYLINELDNTIVVFNYESATGGLGPVQTVDTGSDGMPGGSFAAEIQVDRAGRFLYGSKRGGDRLVVYAIDPRQGTLDPVTVVPCGGNWPRHFSIDPSGRWLLVACERSDTIVVFRLDPVSGIPVPTGQIVHVPSPVCIRHLSLPC